MHHVPNARSQQVYELLLNERELCEVSVLLAGEDGVGETAEGKGARQAFELAVRKNVG